MKKKTRCQNCTRLFYLKYDHRVCDECLDYMDKLESVAQYSRMLNYYKYGITR